MANKKKLLVIGFVILDAVALVVLITLAIMKANRTAVLDISLVPSIAKISIGGTDFMSGAHKTYPSEKVEAMISADGFVSKTIEVELGANKTTRIHEFLMPEENNLNYYAKNPEEAAGLVVFSDEVAKNLVRVLSIQKVLPITDFQYGGLNGKSREVAVSELYDCDVYLCLQAIGNFETEKQVDDLIMAKGFNPKDYKIKYEKR